MDLTERRLTPLVTSSARRSYSLTRGRYGGDGPGANSLVHCLSHGGSHLEGIRHTQAFRRSQSLVPKSSVSLTNQKRKASKP